MKKIKTLFMETTKIESEQTVAEVQRVLGRYGAGAIMTEYDKGDWKVRLYTTNWRKLNLRCWKIRGEKGDLSNS